MCQLRQAAELGSLGHVSLVLESRIQEKDYGIFLHGKGILLESLDCVVDPMMLEMSESWGTC